MKMRQKTSETGLLSDDAGHGRSQVRCYQTLTRSIDFCAFNLKKCFQHNIKETHDDEVILCMRQPLQHLFQSNASKSIDHVGGWLDWHGWKDLSPGQTEVIDGSLIYRNSCKLQKHTSDLLCS